VVVEGGTGPTQGKLVGIITLSDVLRYVIGEPVIGSPLEPTTEHSSELQTPLPGSEAGTNGVTTPAAIYFWVNSGSSLCCLRYMRKLYPFPPLWKRCEVCRDRNAQLRCEQRDLDKLHT
jgi:hypothetical protein